MRMRELIVAHQAHQAAQSAATDGSVIHIDDGTLDGQTMSLRELYAWAEEGNLDASRLIERMQNGEEPTANYFGGAYPSAG